MLCSYALDIAMQDSFGSIDQFEGVFVNDYHMENGCVLICVLFSHLNLIDMHKEDDSIKKA